MHKMLIAALVISGLAGCGRDKDGELARDSTLAGTDSSYALNDRPAPSPAR